MENILGFHQQATRLEEITGIPPLEDTRSPVARQAEMQAWQQATEAAAAGFAADIRAWGWGFQLLLERHKAGLIRAYNYALENGIGWMERHCGGQLAAMPRRAFQIRSMLLLPADDRRRDCLGADALVSAYRRGLESCPEITRWIRETGRTDIGQSEAIADRCVSMIAEAVDQAEVKAID
jgi:hypothetical protein